VTNTQLAICLYGSHARGDADAWSDHDVLVVGTPSESAAATLLDGLGPRLSISHYEWYEIEAMAKYGSLFLQHVRLEGNVLLEMPRGSRCLQSLLGDLGPYRRSVRDLRTFRLALDDIRSAPRPLTNAIFEMAALATMLRHSAVLGCYLTGTPRFGRVEAFRCLCDRWSIPTRVSDAFGELYRFRLHEEGRGDLPYMPTWPQVEGWSGFAESFLDKLEEVVLEYENRLSATH